jgi:hypothetical protein
MTVEATEFLRRFFLHVLPKGFVRIRHFGLLSNRFRNQSLPLARRLLAIDARDPLPTPVPKAPTDGTPLWHCPKCGRPMFVARRLTAAEVFLSRDLDSPRPSTQVRTSDLLAARLGICVCTTQYTATPSHFSIHMQRSISGNSLTSRPASINICPDSSPKPLPPIPKAAFNTHRHNADHRVR